MPPAAVRRPLALALLVAVGMSVAGCGVLAGERATVVPTDAGTRPTVVPSAPATSAAPSTPSVAPPADGLTDCAGAAVTLSGADVDFTLVGDCPAVTVNGTDLDIDAAGATVGSLQLGGDRNELDAQRVETLAVGGQENEIDAVEIGSLAVNGDRNEVEADVRIGAVAVSGNDNRVTAPERGPVTDNGQRNTVGAP